MRAYAVVGLLLVGSCLNEPSATSPLWGKWSGNTVGSARHAPASVVVKLVPASDSALEAEGWANLTTAAGDTLLTCATVYAFRGSLVASLSFYNCSPDVGEVTLGGILSADGASIQGTFRGGEFDGESVALSRSRR